MQPKSFNINNIKTNIVKQNIYLIKCLGNIIKINRVKYITTE